MNWRHFLYYGLLWVPSVLITCWLVGLEFDWRMAAVTGVASMCAGLAEKWWPI